MTAVRWGFIGAGGIAKGALAPAVHAAAGAVLHAVAARDPARAAALGPVRVHDNYEQLLGDPEVDAVYISLSNEAHLPWTLAALEAGKHVLCEKPFCLTAQEVDQIAERQGDLLAVEASWYRWHPRIRLTQQHLADIGPVRHVEAGFVFSGDLEGNYRLDPDRGGGALYDVGHYSVSAALWAVGRGLPDQASTTMRRTPRGVDLMTETVLEWRDGATAQVRAAIDEPFGQWLVITGERGELELRDLPYSSYKTGTCELWLSDGKETTRHAVPLVDAYQLMVEEMSSAISGGPGWVLPLSESRLTAAALDQIRASADD